MNANTSPRRRHRAFNPLLSHLTDATPSTRAQKSSSDTARSIPNGSPSPATSGWTVSCERVLSSTRTPPNVPAAKMTKRLDSPPVLAARHLTRVTCARGRRTNAGAPGGQLATAPPAAAAATAASGETSRSWRARATPVPSALAASRMSLDRMPDRTTWRARFVVCVYVFVTLASEGHGGARPSIEVRRKGNWRSAGEGSACTSVYCMP